MIGATSKSKGDAALAEALAAARREQVDPLQLARVKARALAGGGEAVSYPSPRLGPRVHWAYVTAGVAVLALLAALQLARSREAPAREPVSAAAVKPAVQPSHAWQMDSAAHEPTLPPPEAPLPKMEPPAPRKSPRRAQVVETPPPAAAPESPVVALSDPEAELAILRRALAALPRQPAQALALAEQHAREHVNGTFAQEREVLAIDASLALQLTAAAEARARRFLADYPRSSHAPRMRALLGGALEREPTQQERPAKPTHLAP